MPRKKEKDLLAFVEGLLDLFDGSQHTRDYGVGGPTAEHILPLTYFHHVHPFMDNPCVDLDEPNIFKNVQPRDLDGQTWDISIIDHNLDTQEECGEKSYIMRRYRRVPPKDLRGRKLYSPVISENAVALVFIESRRVLTARTHSFLVNGQWVSVENCFTEDVFDGDGQRMKVKFDPGPRHRYETDPGIALGMQFKECYEWHVDIQRENGVELSFETDSYGAQELFRLRDVPEGAKRRAALRNWVMEHWRQTRDVETRVRRHLRGAESFHWNGLQCTVRPSADDLRLNEKYRLEREAERRGGVISITARTGS